MAIKISAAAHVLFWNCLYQNVIWNILNLKSKERAKYQNVSQKDTNSRLHIVGTVYRKYIEVCHFDNGVPIVECHVDNYDAKNYIICKTR